MEEFVLPIDANKFRSTNPVWNALKLNDPWSVGYVTTLIEAENWKNKEEWENAYYESGKVRNEYIKQNAAKLGCSKEFFNDVTISYDKQKYYNLSWDIKNINTQNERTKEDIRSKGEILYEAVKNNGYGLTLDECVECVRFRVICETWNGVILREHNTKKTLSQMFPELIIKETPGEIDHTYAVDLELLKNDKLLCGVQVKPESYIKGYAPYLVKARKVNAAKYALYKKEFGVSVFTIISKNTGEILNPGELIKIKQLLL